MHPEISFEGASSVMSFYSEVEEKLDGFLNYIVAFKLLKKP